MAGILTWRLKILLIDFGGDRPWRRAMAESKTTAPSTPALTHAANVHLAIVDGVSAHVNV
jgi:hypothetical protein